MNDFEQLKSLWQQQELTVGAPDPVQLKKNNEDHQRKLERVQLVSAILLLMTTVFILWIGFFSGITFHSTRTYVAVVLIALIPAVQGIINLTVYARLKRVQLAASTTQHLQQWQDYYAFRKRLIRLNLPIYYLLLNGAFALYFIEILGHFSLTGRIIALSLYTAWMLFAYFVLGKRSLRKEYGRLDAIISNLQALQQQLDNTPSKNDPSKSGN